MSAIDLSAYFERIGYQGGREPTIDTLTAIHLAHVTTIPFENINSWTNRRVSLKLADLETKLVTQGRGGYCFEQNALLAAVLRELGFSVSEIVARVCWNQPPTGLTHMLLVIGIDGEKWIADVGFGAIGQTVPLKLEAGLIQPTPHETRRYQLEEGIFTQQVQLGPETWEDVYFFDLKPALPIDYEVGNWFTNTYPDSLFRRTLIATLPQADHRRTIAFGEFTRRYLDGRIEKQAITSDDDLRRLLHEEFGIPADDAALAEAGLTAIPISM